MKKIPPFKLELKPLSLEAEEMPKFRWASDEIGTRHKIGGEPQFIQGEDWPVCHECKEKMSFFAQLDSLNDEFCVADCGMIYIFVCFDCNETSSIIQSY
jgi:uncharacterized protein YwqG